MPLLRNLFPQTGRVKRTLDSNSSVPEFLLSSQRFGIQLGLMRMESLMRRLGNPQEDLSCIHIAGTNGKGSVTSYIASMLAADHHRVGVYTSPYLERFSERIRILDGQDALERMLADDSEGEIPRKDLFALSDQVEQAVREMLADDEEHPTEFELVTAVAFLYFKKMHCNYVVLETGLGGRLDSTNIVRSPVCSVITALGFDHMDRLGNTMREIAAEKGGIIKKNCPVYLYSPCDAGLSGPDSDDASDAIASICSALASPLTIVSATDSSLLRSSADGQDFMLSFLPRILHISLIGSHQIQNAALAVRTVLALVSIQGILLGLSRTTWKGRLEILRKSPLFLLDGGHNPQGAQSFRSAIDELFARDFQSDPPIILLGFMEDKDYPQILSILFSNLSYRFREIICITPDNPRALSANVLRDYILKHFPAEALFYKNQTTMYNKRGKISAYDQVQTACEQVLSESKTDGSPILCVGSLYLAGLVRSACKNDL